MCILQNSDIFGMRSEILLRGAALLIFAALITTSFANPYLEEEDGLEEPEDYDNNLERFLQQTQEKRGSRIYTPMRDCTANCGGSPYLRPAERRSCIRRGGNCDHQHENCCYNSTCRCNLWGSNCRCQRMGLFQKWGK